VDCPGGWVNGKRSRDPSLDPSIDFRGGKKMDFGFWFVTYSDAGVW
jgi:hypothetical protein